MAKIALCDVEPKREDIAASLVSTICYSIGGQVAAVCASCQVETCVFVGGFLSVDGIIPKSLAMAVNLFRPNVLMVFPENHRFVGAIGAATK